ncbi:TRAP transporter small permease [Alkalihalobacillus trypoxylicola]|uniref:C4-dicarboxylate ABC transporter permease n=1 Tax=Alkalihalobacillus trypoxylicola TaxID=519424 RepID=A0A162DFL8_9BACI|nr:TRAP transporter small permease [Alkalihalobacillus trypoxylicola]KYG29470.1 C4-dicarboxylate ABC transporter permease [Alkalihalobacillus trypoxylicola]
MNLYLKFIDRLNTSIKYIVSGMLLVLAILVFLQVITRFVINVPLSWTEEIARYLMVYIVFLGSGLAMRAQQHIAIDFLLDVISAKNKKRLTYFILWVCVAFFSLLVFFGTHLTLLVMSQSTPTLQYSMAFAYAAVPIGSSVMLLNAIAVLIDLKKERVVEAETVGDLK